MPSKKHPNAPSTANTVAPPANVSSLDLEKEFGDMTIRPGKTMAGEGLESSSRRAVSEIPRTSSRQDSSSVQKKSKGQERNHHSKHDSGFSSKRHESSGRPSTLSGSHEKEVRKHNRNLSSITESGSSSKRYESYSRPSTSSRLNKTSETHKREISPGGTRTTTYKSEKKGPLGGIFGGNEKTEMKISYGSSIRGNGEERFSQGSSHGGSHHQHHSSSSSSHPYSSQYSALTRSHSSSSHGLQTSPNHTFRVPTELSETGNMDRTYFEGLVPVTEYQNRSLSQASYPRSTEFHKSQAVGRTLNTNQAPRAMPAIHENSMHSNFQKSLAPVNSITTLANPRDIQMASRQTHFASLGAIEQAQQNSWAQTQIHTFAPCPEGFHFKRVGNGYICNGGHHFICDELLAEGKGGLWILPDSEKTEKEHRWGPYYAEQGRKDLFYFSGEGELPYGAPELCGEGCSREKLGGRDHRQVLEEYRERQRRLMQGSGAGRYGMAGYQTGVGAGYPGGRGFSSQGWDQNPNY